jgi:ubiquinone/menaquinone biosynthesis C-methylase UbiE
MRRERPAVTYYDTLIQQHFRSTLPYWEQIYDDTGVYGRIYQERARRALAYVDRINLSSRSAVLEVGCGPGVITTALAQRGFYVSAIDTVPEMIERTRTKAQQAGLHSQVSAQSGSINSLPFADCTFELAMVIGVSEWLVSLTGPLSEVFRVLRPGGHLIISADNNWPLHQILDPLVNPAMKPLKAWIGKLLRFARLRTVQPRVHAYSLRGFDNELSNSGFEKIAGQTLGFGPFTLCNRKLLNEETGWELHLGLQKLADKGVPLLRSAGLVYIALTRKPPVL